MRAQEISRQALGVLASLEYKENSAAITAGQLAPDLYAEVNEVLTRLGGRWRGGRTKAHLFPHDPAPLIRAVIASQEMPPKNPNAYFPTPPAVIEEMMAWAEPDRLLSTDLILEPSAGTGALADALRKAGCGDQLRLVEMDPLNAQVLRDKGYQVTESNFLQFQPPERYGLIVMNPPFSISGDREAYIAHILHAWSLLKPGGRLVAIAPSGYTYRSNSARVRAFLDFVYYNGHFERLPKGAFRDSGTMTDTTLIIINKLTAAEEQSLLDPHDGYRNHYCYLLDVTARSSQPFCEASQALYGRIGRGHYTIDLFGDPEPDLAAKIRALYDGPVADLRRGGGMIRMTPEDWAWMAREFIKECQAWLAEQEPSTTLMGEASERAA